MVSKRALGVLSLLVVSGCYQPSFRDCMVRCGSDQQCPSGLTCSQGYCSGSAICAMPKGDGSAMPKGDGSAMPRGDGSATPKGDGLGLDGARESHESSDAPDGTSDVLPDSRKGDGGSPDERTDSGDMRADSNDSSDGSPDAVAGQDAQVAGTSPPFSSRVNGVAQLATALGQSDYDTVATAASRSEAESAGYVWYYTEGWVFTGRAPETIPLQHYYLASRNDNFTTASAEGIADAIALGYTLLRTEGYIYAVPEPGTVPLNLYWGDALGDNLTTANPAAQKLATQRGYTFVRTEGYVFANVPYVPNWWYWSDVLGDNVSTAAGGDLSMELELGGWTFIAMDAAYLIYNVPGTTSAETYFSSALADYYTVVRPADKLAALQAGYVLVQTEGYVFDAPYSSSDVVPLTTYWSSIRQDNFTTYVGGSAALSSDEYIALDVQGYGLSIQ